MPTSVTHSVALCSGCGLVCSSSLMKCSRRSATRTNKFVGRSSAILFVSKSCLPTAAVSLGLLSVEVGIFLHASAIAA